MNTRKVLDITKIFVRHGWVPLTAVVAKACCCCNRSCCSWRCWAIHGYPWWLRHSIPVTSSSTSDWSLQHIHLCDKHALTNWVQDLSLKWFFCFSVGNIYDWNTSWVFVAMASIRRVRNLQYYSATKCFLCHGDESSSDTSLKRVNSKHLEHKSGIYTSQPVRSIKVWHISYH